MGKTLNTPLTAILLSIIFGALAGGIVNYALESKTTEDLIKEFYEVENAVSVSPHHIRKHITDEDKDFILVDLRSQEEYETAHVLGALSVPAYASPDKSAYGDVERIVNGFRSIQSKHPDKEIIVYCYSMPCMTGKKIGKMLAEHNIYVKHLNIGWQEWRYYWNLWNHDGETQVNPEDYITSGPAPNKTENGTPGSSGCSIGGEFEC